MVAKNGLKWSMKELVVKSRMYANNTWHYVYRKDGNVILSIVPPRGGV